MRLNQTQLNKHLTQGLAPLYVLVGSEPLAQRESLDALRQAAQHQGYEERTSLIAERFFKWQELTHFGQSSSLFSNLRVLEIHIPSGKPGVDGGKVLKELATQPLPDTCVIIVLPRLERDARNSAWYTSLEKAAIVIALDEIAVNQLPKWIATRLANQQQETDEETLLFLATQVEGNLLAANQEIEKLGLLYPTGKLSNAAVKEAVLSVSRYDAFQLGEAVLAGDTPRTVRVLQGLQDEGAQPLSVMNPLLWSLKPLAQLKLAQQQGENLEQAMTRARIFGQKQALIKRALAKLSMRQIEACIQKLADIDQTAKGVMQGDTWLEISRLCFGLSKLCAR